MYLQWSATLGVLTVVSDTTSLQGVCLRLSSVVVLRLRPQPSVPHLLTVVELLGKMSETRRADDGRSERHLAHHELAVQGQVAEVLEPLPQLLTQTESGCVQNNGCAADIRVRGQGFTPCQCQPQ